MKLRLLVIVLILICCVSCSKLIDMTVPAKKPILSNTPLAMEAEQNFWDTLHQGGYNNLPKTIYLLSAAYIENPHDPNLAAFLGFAHIWMIAERQRQQTLDPRIVEHITLAKKYFADAITLAPHDPRVLGFYGDALLIEGKIFNDQRAQTKAYFILKRAIHAWPQFNYFTAGYPLSTLPSNSKLFNQGLVWQWKTLDICAGQRIDHYDPDFYPYMKLETQKGLARACWNSWIAPHNFEGFFLNFGDMLVKKGDWQTAIKIYRNARLSKTYFQWPYRDVLEQRILNARENVQKFNQSNSLTQRVKEPAMMFNSSFSCMACHQKEIDLPKIKLRKIRK